MTSVSGALTKSSASYHESLLKELLRRKQAAEGLLAFTQYTKPDFQVGQHHRVICDALDKVEQGAVKRLIIDAPPRHTKSELASRRFPAKYIGKHPTRQIAMATYGAELANDFGRDVRDIVASEEYQQIFPEVGLRADSKAANRWQTTDDGIYVAQGVGGSLTGRGAHIGIVDDPFKDRESADSEIKRKRVWDWYRSVFLTRLMPGGAIIVIATRWHEDDLTGKILERAKETGEHWEHISMQALNDKDEALWPEWYDSRYLKNLRDTIGAREWMSLYQQRPTAEEGTYFQKDWFESY